MNQILLSPEHVQLIFIDFQSSFEKCYDSKNLSGVLKAVIKLVRSAQASDVPVLTSSIENNRINSGIYMQLEQIISLSNRFCRNGANPWIDPTFVHAINVNNRPRLVLAGLSIETSLSFTALCALEHGFDVYVIKDTCLGHSEAGINAAFERLAQAGVVMVSWRQVLMEWSQGSVELGQLRRILKSV